MPYARWKNYFAVKCSKRHNVHAAADDGPDDDNVYGVSLDNVNAVSTDKAVYAEMHVQGDL